MPVIEILLLYYKYIISLRHDETPLFVNWLRPTSLSLSLSLYLYLYLINLHRPFDVF